MNPVILVAIIIQAVISKFSCIAGAVFGYIITTGMLLWGISVYGEGNQIALFGVPVSESIFLIACLIWYGLDTRGFIIARKQASTAKMSPKGQTPVSKEPFPKSESGEDPLEVAIAARRLVVSAISTLITCPNCKMTVILKPDGICPSCQARISV